MCCCWLPFHVCVSYWRIALSEHTVNCIHRKAEQRSGESWKLMEVMIAWGGCHVPQNMGGGGSGRRKLGGQVRENEGREQRLNFSWIARARACLPASSPAWLHTTDDKWASLDNWGSSIFCALSPLALLWLLDELHRLQAFLHSWLQQSWFIYTPVFSV